jgi:hypothetical protein
MARASAWRARHHAADLQVLVRAVRLAADRATAQSVGAPTAAVKPESAQPPENSPRMSSPLSPAASR